MMVIWPDGCSLWTAVDVCECRCKYSKRHRRLVWPVWSRLAERIPAIECDAPLIGTGKLEKFMDFSRKFLENRYIFEKPTKN